MKKYLLLYKILFLSLPAFAQLSISTGTQWVNTGNITVNINGLNLVNNGSFSAGNSNIKFSGNAVDSIGGNSVISFYQLEIAKGANSKIVLLSNIEVASQVNFTSGLMDLNQKNLILAGTAILNNENENSRIIAPTGGEASITLNLNAPNAANAGNLGAIITSASDLGVVTIKRGHVEQSGTGLTGSILRYYSISPQTNTALNATMRLKYFDAEKNGKDENNFVIFQSDDGGSNWTNQSQTAINSLSDYVEKTGLSSLSKFTLSDNAVVSNCSATGVVLSVKSNKQNVMVNWSTATETNNQGFGVERKLKGEPDFSQLSFVNSKAIGGNSLSQLSYSYADVNPSVDTSYYRLKIVGLDASTCYSDIKIFVPKGGKKGPGNINIINTDTTQTFATTKAIRQEEAATAKLTVGPNPNNGNFWFMVGGIEKETIATIYSLDGKVLKQFHVSNLQQQQVFGFRSGVYILKVENLPPFRIIVQSGEKPINNFPLITTSSIKN